jgi:two-component sensor histidine kinase
VGADKTSGISDPVLNTILDGIGEGFYAVDSDWRIILFNNEAALHFHRPREEMLGRVLWEVLPGARETGLGQLFVRTMQSRATVRSEDESVVYPGRFMAYRLFPLGDGMGVVFRDTTARRKAEAQRDLLVTELGHRIRNTLAIVQSIATQTFGPSGDPSLHRTFQARLVALGNAHAALSPRNWQNADLAEVIEAAVRPHCAPEDGRLTAEGPQLQLGPKSAVALSMAVHELCTNAVKYGALSAPAGRVDIIWTAQQGRLHWQWRERGGPQVSPPARKGFGSVLVERSLAAQLSGHVSMDYALEGLTCTIDAPLAAVRDN